MSMINKERLLDTFLRYARISSPSGNERAVADAIREDLELFTDGFYEDRAGESYNGNTGNIYFSLKGEEGAEPLLFSAHMDTVIPCDNVTPVIRDGYVYSDGRTILGADDKSGIAAIVEAIRVVSENGLRHRPIEVLFSICEEVGLYGAKNAELERIRSKKAIVCDSGGDVGHYVVAAPGQDKIQAKITGRPAHAGARPEDGCSALMAAAEAVSRMKLLRIDEETTANIGTLKSEGPTNIVSPEAVVIGEARSRNPDKLAAQTAHMVEELRRACDRLGTELEVEVESCYRGYVHDEEDELLGFVKNQMKRLGFSPVGMPTGGGSDANIFYENGICALAVGCGMERGHTLEERIEVKQIENLATLMLGLMVLE